MSQTLSPEQLQNLCEIAVQAAQEAGQWIAQYDRRNLQKTFKDAGSSAASQIVTEVDIASEKIIRQRLEMVSEQLGIAFVGEESYSSNAHERFEKPYFWCVDPLDGTLAFAEGHSGYAVSIALLEQSGKPLIGVVYDPDNQVLYHAIKGQGCYRNLQPFKQSTHASKSLNVYADASFKTHEHYELTISALEQYGQNLELDGLNVIYGSGAVVNACQVFNSGQACYVKPPRKEQGGGSIWDFAATACIANETGAWVSNSFGQTLDLNRPDSTFMNHQGIVFASNKQLANLLVDLF